MPPLRQDNTAVLKQDFCSIKRHSRSHNSAVTTLASFLYIYYGFKKTAESRLYKPRMAVTQLRGCLTSQGLG